MVGSSIYLDYNATAPVRPEVRALLAGLAETPGNPSSIHAFGRAARRLLEDARETVAAMTGGQPAGVIFTSGGTEANNMALGAFGGRRILASAVEHPSLLRGLGAADDMLIGVDADGVVDLAALETALARPGRPALVALMAANNETGVIQPVAEAARLARRYGAHLHCDAVQAAGRLELAALGADSYALSAHKLGGLAGMGALVLADADAEVTPLMAGGGQERGHRAGTENLLGAQAFAAAVAATLPGMGGEQARQAGLRDGLEARLAARFPQLVFFGRGAARLANTSCLAVAGLPAQRLLMGLDLAGIAVSAGSACSSGKLAPSPVLRAMGAEALAGAAIRISLGWDSRGQDVERFVEIFSQLVERWDEKGAAHAA